MQRPNLIITLKARIKDDPVKQEQLLVKVARAIKDIPELSLGPTYSDITKTLKPKRR
jgi:hypothetical protein